MEDLKLVVNNDKDELIPFVDVGIRNVHLISGEDIIGHVYAAGSLVRVKEPLVPHIRQTSPNDFKIGLIPYRPYLKSGVELEIPVRHIIFFGEVTDDMENLYRSQTSGIVSAAPSTIVTP